MKPLPPLVWVHKTKESTSLSKSESREEHRRIFRQAQQYPFGARRLLKQKALSTSTRDLKFGWRLAEEQEEPSSANGIKPAPPRARLDSRDRENTSIRRGSPEAKQEQPVRLIAPSENATDPFHCTAAKLDSQAHMTLDLHATLSYPVRWCSCSRTPISVPRNVALHAIQLSISTKLQMYSLLVVTAFRLRHLDFVKLSGGIDGIMTKCLRVLRYDLKTLEAVQWEHVWSTLHLSAAEAYRFDYNAALMHTRAAKAMIDCLGGVPSTEKALMCTILIVDVYPATELLSTPIFPCFHELDTTDDLWGRESSIESYEDQFGTGFWIPDTDSPANTDLAAIIASMTSTLRRVLNLSRKKIRQPEEVMQWLQTKGLIYRHQLLALAPTDPRTKAVRIALILHIHYILGARGNFRTILAVLPRLRHSIEDTDDIDWILCPNMLIWILTVGAVAAHEASKDAYFVVNLEKWMDMQRIKSLPELEEVLGCFLYIRELQNASLAAVLGRTFPTV